MGVTVCIKLKKSRKQEKWIAFQFFLKSIIKLKRVREGVDWYKNRTMTRTESKRVMTKKVNVKREKTQKKTMLDEAHEAIAMIKAMGIHKVKEDVNAYDALLLLIRAEYAQEKYDARYM